MKIRHRGRNFRRQRGQAFVEYVILIAVVALSKIQFKVILKSMKPLLFIILLTGLLNLFYTQGTPLVSFWIFTISREETPSKHSSWTVQLTHTRPAKSRPVSSAKWAAAETMAATLPFMSEAPRP